jgi:hypothetical protein
MLACCRILSGGSLVDRDSTPVYVPLFTLMPRDSLYCREHFFWAAR